MMSFEEWYEFYGHEYELENFLDLEDKYYEYIGEYEDRAYDEWKDDTVGDD